MHYIKLQVPINLPEVESFFEGKKNYIRSGNDNSSFTLIEVEPFCETVTTTVYNFIGTLDIIGTHKNLYSVSYTVKTNLFTNSGSVGCAGISHPEKTEEWIQERLASATTLTSILSAFVKNRLYYIHVDAPQCRFPKKIIEEDILDLVQQFYADK